MSVISTEFVGSWLTGKEAEFMFFHMAMLRGYKIEIVTDTRQWTGHIDFVITKNNKSTTVDVKAAKKINRTDETITDGALWIELKNVRGNQGWANSNVDYFAFWIDGKFYFISNAKMKDLIKRTVGENYQIQIVPSSFKKVEKTVYRREGREDEIFFVYYDDVKDFFTNRQWSLKDESN